jgi:acetylornithine deacetylase/succinyl-diaminopimelate desuccinylase-like protein
MIGMRFLLFAFVVSINAFSQSTTVDKIRVYRTQNERKIINDFFSFLQIPNVATDDANIAKNASWLSEQMKAKGIENVSLLASGEKNVPPVVYGEINVPTASKTIIFYAHYDGQPVNPALWAKGLHPFQPQLLNGKIEDSALVQSLSSAKFPLNEDWRIYARGSSDDKAGVMAILTASDAINQSGLKPQYNIKFFFEGEEEQGSTHLSQILEKYKSQLKADLWIICDGPVHQSGV